MAIDGCICILTVFKASVDVRKMERNDDRASKKSSR